MSETYYHIYSAEEVKVLIADAIEGMAAGWEKEAAEESRRGAADRSKVGALQWGADRLRSLGATIRDLPDGEEREVDENGSPDVDLESDAESNAQLPLFQDVPSPPYGGFFSMFGRG